MTGILPREVQEGLDAARRLARRRASRLRAECDGHSVPVIALRDGGFVVDRGSALGLRGLVDLYDGAEHMYQCLIVASEEDGDDIRFDYKRGNSITSAPPADYAPDPDRPRAYLPRPD